MSTQDLSQPPDNLSEWDTYTGGRIRLFRTMRDMSQSTLAEMVGLTRASISNIESGRQGVSAAVLWKIARALDYPMDVIVDAPTSEIEVRAQLVNLQARVRDAARLLFEGVKE